MHNNIGKSHSKLSKFVNVDMQLVLDDDIYELRACVWPAVYLHPYAADDREMYFGLGSIPFSDL